MVALVAAGAGDWDPGVTAVVVVLAGGRARGDRDRAGDDCHHRAVDAGRVCRFRGGDERAGRRGGDAGEQRGCAADSGVRAG